MVSPLTRGLRGRLAGPELGGGIIPARAGFTIGFINTPSYTVDHPRSRGVYAAGGGQITSGAGSSPLARGLPVPPRIREVQNRIITARAGFTGRTWPTNSRVRDHPRSRGVYIIFRTVLENANGSSPLARGLRRWIARESAGAGIIPARAGFTSRQ